jgi:hypothetical protein
MTTPGHSPVSRPLYHKLLGETARVHWQELERLFAQGKLLLVAAELDLVVVAEAIASDDARRVAAWVASGQLQNLPASLAGEFAASQSQLWAVVVSPWVCVQQRN